MEKFANILIQNGANVNEPSQSETNLFNMPLMIAAWHGHLNLVKLLVENGLKAEEVKKLKEGRPNMMDIILNGEVDLIVNTPIGSERKEDDSYLRKAAIKTKTPYMTTIAAAKATIEGIEYLKNNSSFATKSLQQLHSEIKPK